MNKVIEVCPYCGKPAKLTDSSVVYGKSYGLVYLCSNFPACDAYVGVHKGTVKPLGQLANKETREGRKKAHAILDRLWKTGAMSRKQAYKELAKNLGVEEIHIGESDIVSCEKIIIATEQIILEFCFNENREE